MSRKYYRFFGGLIKTQEKWLNKLAAEGYRLTNTGKLLYEFEKCDPNEYQYCIDFVADKSKYNAESYREFLEELGYRVFYKNINLRWSIGKAEVRPWAEKGGRIAMKSSTLDKELMIIEKHNDGKPFELRTTAEDRILYIKRMKAPWVFMLLIFAVCGIFTRSAAFLAAAAICLAFVSVFQAELIKLKKNAEIME